MTSADSGPQDSGPADSGPSCSGSDPLLARVEGRLGHLTLNRPQRINALNLELIDRLAEQLAAWADDDAVELVLLDGAGERGLCAGGDIKALYQGIVGGLPVDRFFVNEYALNAVIAHYPKPYVAVMDGIAMGGGVGVSAHGSHRIVTERTTVAMPETAIGLFPDVGALYLLARSPGEWGTHLALTGGRLDAAGAIGAGLADHFVPSGDLPGLVARLAEQGIAGLSEVGSAALACAPDGYGDWVDECYCGDDAEQIVARLRAHSAPEAAAAADTIEAASPTSVTVTLAALRRAASMTVDEVLAQDLTLARAFLGHPDLPEGIRAQVIDKDRRPTWSPASLAEVDATATAEFFG